MVTPTRGGHHTPKPIFFRQPLKQRIACSGGEGRSMFPQLDALIQDIAAAAAGDFSRRAEVMAALQRMTQHGWELEPVVARIWAGERSTPALTHGLDPQEAQIIQDVLALLALAGPEDSAAPHQPAPLVVLEALADWPAPLRQAFQTALEAGDEAALQDAYQAAADLISPRQDERLRQALSEWAAQAEVAWAEQSAADWELYDLEPALLALANGSGEDVEGPLAYLETLGLDLRPVVQRLWAGERDAAALCAGLEGRERRVAERLLELAG